MGGEHGGGGAHQRAAVRLPCIPLLLSSVSCFCRLAPTLTCSSEGRWQPGRSLRSPKHSPRRRCCTAARLVRSRLRVGGGEGVASICRCRGGLARPPAHRPPPATAHRSALRVCPALPDPAPWPPRILFHRTASMESAGDLQEPLVTPVECLEDGAGGVPPLPRLRHQWQHPAGLQYYQLYLRMVSAVPGCWAAPGLAALPGFALPAVLSQCSPCSAHPTPLHPHRPPGWPCCSAAGACSARAASLGSRTTACDRCGGGSEARVLWCGCRGWLPHPPCTHHQHTPQICPHPLFCRSTFSSSLATPPPSCCMAQCWAGLWASPARAASAGSSAGGAGTCGPPCWARRPSTQPSGTCAVGWGLLLAEPLLTVRAL